MRQLSERQARRCEEAEHPKCRCRCHGLLHGGKRWKTLDDDAPAPDRAFFEQLPEEDPHYLKARPGATAAPTRPPWWERQPIRQEYLLEPPEWRRDPSSHVQEEQQPR